MNTSIVIIATILAFTILLIVVGLIIVSNPLNRSRVDWPQLEKFIGQYCEKIANDP